MPWLWTNHQRPSPPAIPSPTSTILTQMGKDILHAPLISHFATQQSLVIKTSSEDGKKRSRKNHQFTLIPLLDTEAVINFAPSNHHQVSEQHTQMLTKGNTQEALVRSVGRAAI